jgi:hypothetical protein
MKYQTNSALLIFAAVCHVSVDAVRNLRIVSPLQALTIPDPEVKEEITTARRHFLDRFKVGLEAESKARRELAEKKSEQLQADATAPDWAKQAASSVNRIRNADEKHIETAFDNAVAQFDRDRPSKKAAKNSNRYQFVGLINSASSKTPIMWYARKKPTNARWSVRLVHADQAAIVKDLFNRGKVDIFARYENIGKASDETKGPIVESTYAVRERSWKNLWNTSPKHWITDSSGMYWRERRLRPGMYTDGKTVYESSYRYRDGRNGMHQRSTLDQFLSSKAFDDKGKQRILRRLKEDAPDVVLEE